MIGNQKPGEHLEMERPPPSGSAARVAESRRDRDVRERNPAFFDFRCVSSPMIDRLANGRTGKAIKREALPDCDRRTRSRGRTGGIYLAAPLVTDSRRCRAIVTQLEAVLLSRGPRHGRIGALRSASKLTVMMPPACPALKPFSVANRRLRLPSNMP